MNALHLFLGLHKVLLFVPKAGLFAAETTDSIPAESGGCRAEHTGLNITGLFGWWSPVRGQIKYDFSILF